MVRSNPGDGIKRHDRRASYLGRRVLTGNPVAAGGGDPQHQRAAIGQKKLDRVTRARHREHPFPKAEACHPQPFFFCLHLQALLVELMLEPPLEVGE